MLSFALSRVRRGSFLQNCFGPQKKRAIRFFLHPRPSFSKHSSIVSSSSPLSIIFCTRLEGRCLELSRVSVMRYIPRHGLADLIDICVCSLDSQVVPAAEVCVVKVFTPIRPSGTFNDNRVRISSPLVVEIFSSSWTVKSEIKGDSFAAAVLERWGGGGGDVTQKMAVKKTMKLLVWSEDRKKIFLEVLTTLSREASPQRSNAKINCNATSSLRPHDFSKDLKPEWLRLL